jgi:hypothetical protein
LEPFLRAIAGDETRHAIQALGQIGGDDAAAMLREKLDDPRLHGMACNALEQMGPAGAKVFLNHLLTAPTPAFRREELTDGNSWTSTRCTVHFAPEDIICAERFTPAKHHRR